MYWIFHSVLFLFDYSKWVIVNDDTDEDKGGGGGKDTGGYIDSGEEDFFVKF